MFIRLLRQAKQTPSQQGVCVHRTVLVGTRCCFSLLFMCVQPELGRLLAHHLRTTPHGAELCSRTRLLWLAVVQLALNA